MQSVKSIVQHHAGGIVVDVECHISNGLPTIIIVGLGNKAVDEARERVRSAFVSCNIPFPKKRVTINLAPADTPKDSTGLDLAIAIAILQTSGLIQHIAKPNEAALGELGLDGSVRPVRGLIGKLLAARAKGIRSFYIPKANAEQASLVPDITFAAIGSLNDYLQAAHCSPSSPPDKFIQTVPNHQNLKNRADSDISLVTGQDQAKRALQIAAAGGHNICISGPPGTGKSMLAKALPSLLPPMTNDEILEVTHLHSLASSNYDDLICERPFRSPHHSASYVSLVGGGAPLRPGEISLSHRGVLFLDEMPEFSRQALEALRQPLEDNIITIARAREVATFPANFILVATANPCPCGYYGSAKECQCPAHLVMQYQRKLSGPIMDRFDLQVQSQEIEHRKLLSTQSDNNEITSYKATILQARHHQAVRYRSPILLNSHLTNQNIRSVAKLTGSAQELLNKAASALVISARAYMRLIKVARTIADLDNAATIEVQHIGEALQYRGQIASTLR